MQRIIKYNKHYVKEVIFLPISSLYEIEQLTFCPDNLILIGIPEILKELFMIFFYHQHFSQLSWGVKQPLSH